MGTKWLKSNGTELRDVLSKFEVTYSDRTLSVIEAKAIVKEQGAFVEIASKSDAEALFLSEVVVLHSSCIEDSYEPAIDTDFTHACFVSGESKTADIEQVLVSGVHGPQECIFVIVQ